MLQSLAKIRLTLFICVIASTIVYGCSVFRNPASKPQPPRDNSEGNPAPTPTVTNTPTAQGSPTANASPSSKPEPEPTTFPSPIATVTAQPTPEVSPTATVPPLPTSTPAALEPSYSSIRQIIFETRCMKCHGNPNSHASHVPLEPLGALLDSPRDLVLPGNPEESGLVLAIERMDDKRMPPSGNTLSDAEKKIIRDWIQLGAPE